ncbi:MAG: radical SAM family heme chaperone HemW [Veillonellales bacterium]
MNLGLYIHIPFCRQKCYYCDFPSYAGLENAYEAYTTALCREISGQGGSFTGQVVDSIYLGGGTPTVLATAQIVKIMQTVYTHFTVTGNAEISIEANPGTVDRLKLQALRDSGINRLSVGVQSFNDRLLRSIGRIHTAEEAVRAVEWAKQAGFTNFNIDLMYGLPGQSLADAVLSIEQAAVLGSTHISAYGLKVEEGTPLVRLLKANRLELPDEAEEEQMYELTVRHLPDLGYQRYEISNFSRPGAECRHNLKYWRFQPYIGLGAAAHSFFAAERYANVADVRRYIVSQERGESAVSYREKTSRADAMAEYIFLALRTVRGLIVADFNQYFQTDFFACYHLVVKQLLRQKLIVLSDKTVRLTVRGMKYGNVAFRAFLPDKV